MTLILDQNLEKKSDFDFSQKFRKKEDSDFWPKFRKTKFF